MAEGFFLIGDLHDPAFPLQRVQPEQAVAYALFGCPQVGRGVFCFVDGTVALGGGGEGLCLVAETDQHG